MGKLSFQKDIYEIRIAKVKFFERGDDTSTRVGTLKTKTPSG